MTDGLALATRGLQKRYGQRPAVTGLDLSDIDDVSATTSGPSKPKPTSSANGRKPAPAASPGDADDEINPWI